jgi:hypothetical protein
MVEKEQIEGKVGVLKKSRSTYSIEGKPGALDIPLPGTSAATASLNLKDWNDDDGSKQGDYKISQWGNDNLFPNNMKDLFANNIVPGLIDFKQDMYYSLGPVLYDDNGKPARDTEVEEWADRWGMTDYLVAAFGDMALHENLFGQFVRNKARNKIHPAHVDAEECRLEVIDKKTKKINHILVKKWDEGKADMAAYPVFDPYLPLKAPISMFHKKKKTPGFKYYALPVYVGMLPKWIPLANEIPSFHLSRMQRSINAKYHVKISHESLKKKKELEGWSNIQLNEWLENELKNIDAMLAGATNAGKVFYSITATDSSGKELPGWEIKLIDNNEKEMSEANLQLYNESNQAITSAMQVQPSLACIQLGQKMSSGSEVLNSYNLHIKTRTPIIRSLVMETVNTCIKVNFPSKKVHYRIADPLLVMQEVDKSGVIDPVNDN